MRRRTQSVTWLLALVSAYPLSVSAVDLATARVELLQLTERVNLHLALGDEFQTR